MATTELALEAPKVRQEGLQIAEQAKALEIVSPQTFAVAAEMLRAVKTYLKRVTELTEPVIRAAHEAHKAAVEQKKRLEAPALEAEGALKGKMEAYEQEQARLRREAEARAEAERQRLQAEADRRAREDMVAAQALAEEAQVARALEAEAHGDEGAVQQILATEPVVVVPPPVPVFVPPPSVDVPQAEGVSFRNQWDFEIEDAALIPREYLAPDLKKIGAVVRALRSEAHIPGVRVMVRRVAAVRV